MAINQILTNKTRLQLGPYSEISNHKTNSLDHYLEAQFNNLRIIFRLRTHSEAIATDKLKLDLDLEPYKIIITIMAHKFKEPIYLFKDFYSALFLKISIKPLLFTLKLLLNHYFPNYFQKKSLL